MNVPAPTTPKRGRPRDPRRDEAILDAALDLVAEVGYDRLTVADLAARAGVGKPTIYLRWPGGKAEVVASAIAARRPGRDADADAGSLREDLLALCRTLAERLRRDAHLAAGLTCRLRESPELAGVFRDHAVEAERDQMRALLRRAEGRGEIADASAVTPLALGLAPSLIHSRVLFTAEPVDEAFVAELVDRILLPVICSPRTPA